MILLYATSNQARNQKALCLHIYRQRYSARLETILVQEPDLLERLIVYPRELEQTVFVSHLLRVLDTRNRHATELHIMKFKLF